jgi:hypothetical protein
MSTIATPSLTQDVLPEQSETFTRHFPVTFYLAGALISAVLASGLEIWGFARHGIVWSSSVVQAHNQLQVVGWCGTLALALGFFVVSASHRVPALMAYSRAVWALWTAGLGLYLIACVSASARVIAAATTLQIAALIVFGVCARRSNIWRAWCSVTDHADLWPSFVLAFLGLASFFVLSLMGAVRGIIGNAAFERRLMLIATWGFAAPAAWAVSSLLLPRLMRLKPVRTRLLLAACILDVVGVAAALAGQIHLAAVLLLHAAIFVPSAVRAFGKRLGPGELSHPVFVRLAYVWLRLGAPLAVWASIHDRAGIWSSSQHTIIVGFVSMLVMVMGEPLVSVFSDAPNTFHHGLELACLLLLNAGCLLHVICEILSSQGYVPWLRHLLPSAALAEFSAFALFAIQIAMTQMANRKGAGSDSRACSEGRAVET